MGDFRRWWPKGRGKGPSYPPQLEGLSSMAVMGRGGYGSGPRDSAARGQGGEGEAPILLGRGGSEYI